MLKGRGREEGAVVTGEGRLKRGPRINEKKDILFKFTFI